MNAKGKYIIQKFFLAFYGTPPLSGHWGYEFVSTYHRVGKDKYRNYEHDWENIWARSEQLLWDLVRDIEKILLMRAICNHIAATVYSFL